MRVALNFFRTHKRQHITAPLISMPEDIVRYNLGRCPAAQPELKGPTRGNLRLTCRTWRDVCTEVTQEITVGIHALDCNTCRLPDMLPHLTRLDLSKATILSPAGLRQLYPLADTLSTLVLPKTMTQDDDALDSIAPLRSLTSLNLGGIALSDNVLLCCGMAFKALKHLASEADTPLVNIWNWNCILGLETLRVPKTNLWVGSDLFQQLSTLRDLDISISYIYCGALAATQHCPELQSLCLPAYYCPFAYSLAELENSTQLLSVRFAAAPPASYGALSTGRLAMKQLKRSLPGTTIALSAEPDSVWSYILAFQSLMAVLGFLLYSAVTYRVTSPLLAWLLWVLWLPFLILSEVYFGLALIVRFCVDVCGMYPSI